jgi:hypothetical protein
MKSTAVEHHDPVIAREAEDDIERMKARAATGSWHKAEDDALG